MAAQSWNLPLEAALRRLHDAYHGWNIWYVPLALGGLTWCAKRHADGTLTGRVPSVKTLSQEHGISHITTEKALAVLKEEGLIHSVIGKGTYVKR